jgi:integrase
LRAMLLELKNERPKGCKYFLQVKGRPLRYNLILEELNHALKAAGFGEYSGTHALRYAASTFARKEEGLDVAQAMLAHADARMTEGYAKLDVNKKVTGVVLKMENMLKRSATIVQPGGYEATENVI